MKTITVSASRQYDIKIGAGLLSAVGQEILQLGGVQTAAIVSDSTVWPIYGQIVKTGLENSGITAFSFVFPAGEESKCASTYLDLVNFLAESKLSRSDVVIALGGGVVGDLAGFAAATYLRGIRFVQLPTTLLAAVDSSVGGKTAIDLPAGKNLCGAFCQPSLVLCDTQTLCTLPGDFFRDGCGEVIKYAVLFDPALFQLLERESTSFNREKVIARCVELKRDVVMADEFDTGLRMKLNLGHTIGHGVEACSQFTLSHGKCVAIGLAMVARAVKCPQWERIVALIDAFGLPVHTIYPVEDIFQYACSDKKRSGSTINLIVPRSIGNCEICPVPVEELKKLIEEGM